MSSILESTDMDGVEPLEQAKKAIAYALLRIKENPQIGYHMGFGTQAFALLTEAAATLWGKPVKEVREQFMPDFTGKSDTTLVRDIRSALEDYQIALERREHGGVAADKFIKLVEEILNGGAK